MKVFRFLKVQNGVFFLTVYLRIGFISLNNRMSYTRYTATRRDENEIFKNSKPPSNTAIVFVFRRAGGN